MAPGGSQLPNGEPAPGGDALVVAPEAAEAGAKVIVRMPDWYPNFPYRWVSWSNWLSAVDTQVTAVKASGDTNIRPSSCGTSRTGPGTPPRPAASTPAGSRTYNEVRKDDPTPRSTAQLLDLERELDVPFLTYAKANNALPDIISWHELAARRASPPTSPPTKPWRQSLGISPRPIVIEEYAETSEVGVPGALVGYIAKFERAGVSNADLAFWNQYGTLGDTLISTGGAPNGAYWLYDWYGAMTGKMVTTVPPAQTGIDGAASVNPARNQVSVIFGGGTGATAVTVNGLRSLRLRLRVNVRSQYTASAGRTTAVAAPHDLRGHLPGHDGSITVPVAMNPPTATTW